MSLSSRRLLWIITTLSAALVLASCAPQAPKVTPSVQKLPVVAPPTPNAFGVYAYSPQQMRAAFGIDTLIQKGFTGKGQTVVIIDSFGSPTLQQDVDRFDTHFHLPPLNVQVLAPIGTVPFDPSNQGMQGWQGETTLDVEIIHAIAPDAHIVLLTSPVDETEGVVGLPQFLQLEQYAVTHHLGSIISQSWGASEVTLNNPAGQQEVQQWTSFYQQATTQNGITFVAASGDSGATDCKVFDTATDQCSQYSPTRSIGFPADEPWVTSTGGTTIYPRIGGYTQRAWSDSEGGMSSFFPEPNYQQALPAAVQSQLQNQRGVPDVAAPADPQTGFAFYVGGQWEVTGGTSAAAPFWAGLIAIANQEAGHSLGFINPALYKLGASNTYRTDFFDIASGNNSQNKNGVSVQGFDAVSGWDPVTGLGAPNAMTFVPALIAAEK